MSGNVIDGVSVQGYQRAGLAPTGTPDASVVPQLTEAVTTLIGAPAEPYGSNSAAASATVAASGDVSDAVGSITGGTADDVEGRAGEISAAIGALNVLLNTSSPPNPDNIGDGIDRTIVELDAINAMFPDVQTFPAPTNSIRAGLAGFLDAAGGAVAATLQGGEPDPETLAFMAAQIGEIASAVGAFRTAVAALTFEPPLPVDPLTADLDALLDAIVVLLP